jgi:hypothetical protein
MLLGLAGCAPKPGARTEVSPEQDVKANCTRLYADSRIDPVRNHIQLPLVLGTPQDIERLSARDRVADVDRPALKALWEAKEACRKYGEEKLGALPAHRARSEDEVSDSLGDLYEGTISYGQFARRMLFIGARDKAARESIDDELRQREKWRKLNEYGE